MKVVQELIKLVGPFVNNFYPLDKAYTCFLYSQKQGDFSNCIYIDTYSCNVKFLTFKSTDRIGDLQNKINGQTQRPTAEVLYSSFFSKLNANYGMLEKDLISSKIEIRTLLDLVLSINNCNTSNLYITLPASIFIDTWPENHFSFSKYLKVKQIYFNFIDINDLSGKIDSFVGNICMLEKLLMLSGCELLCEFQRPFRCLIENISRESFFFEGHAKITNHQFKRILLKKEKCFQCPLNYVCFYNIDHLDNTCLILFRYTTEKLINLYSKRFI